MNALSTVALKRSSALGENYQAASQLSSKSKASRILRMALQAANQMGGKSGQYNESYISGVLNTLVKTYDLRASIFSTFYRAGFDLHELSASEKQVMEMIQLYPFLKNGEIWQDIKQELNDKVSKRLVTNTTIVGHQTDH